VYSSSRCSIEWCAKHYGLDASRTPVIHAGVDTEHFRPRSGAKEHRPTIVFAGRLARNKGVFELLEAAAAMVGQFPDLQLRLLGRGESKVVEELQAKACSLGCASLLDLAGYIPREQLPEQLSRAHVFAAPSVYEGGPGFVYLEAMACGLPVIACAGSGAAEVVREGETGFLVPPDDVGALVAKLRLLLGDSQQRERLGTQARKSVLAEADSRSCLRKLEAFYRSVVS
jgi:starch synthase